MKKTVLALCLILLMSAPSFAKKIIGKVTNVLDGDTIIVTAHGKTGYKIRLYGIYTPDMAQDYGPEAKHEAELICLGKVVKVEVIRKDSLGSLVANVYTQDGTFVNEHMIATGYAWYYKKHLKDKRFALLEETARDGKLGLWAGRKPVPPWNFRGGK